MDLAVPHNLAARATIPDAAAWIAGLPEVLARLRDVWALTVGAPFEPGGHTAWEAPATSVEHGAVVLKVAFRHAEARDEADGLREWAGEGAVRLVDRVVVNDSTVALLVERCRPGTPLTSEPEPDQDEVVAGLLRRLWRDPPLDTPFRPLQLMCDEWADECELALERDPPRIDRGLARDGLALFRDLPSSAPRCTLLCTDLHAGNILAAQREPWLAIDPKPYVGDPTYDALQHLLNCEARLEADPHGLVARMADLCGLDRERLGRWLFARCVVESPHWPAMARVAPRLALLT